MSVSLAVGGILVLHSQLVAQGGVRDPFATLEQGFILEGQSAVLYKPPGDKVVAPGEFGSVYTNPETPVFQAGLVFGSDHLDFIRMDAMSTGNDFVPLVERGVINGEIFYAIEPGVPSSGASWASIIMSVDEQAGEDAAAASTLGLRHSQYSEGSGAELFNYWFAGNTTLPAELDDRAYFVAGSEHLGYDSAQNITALDTFMPLVVSANEKQSVGALVPGALGEVVWYFSIDQASADYIHGEWSDAPGSPKHQFEPGFELSKVTAATIFSTTWDRQNRIWEPITVFRTPDQLGVMDGAEVDGLGVSLRNLDDLVLFSLLPEQSQEPNPGPGMPAFTNSQIFVGGNDSYSTLLIDGPDSQRPQDRIGLRNTSNIDALCGLDPEGVLSPWVATPSTTSMPLGRFGLSAQRYVHASGDIYIQMHATGLPTATSGTLTFFAQAIINDVPAGLRVLRRVRLSGQSEIERRLPLNIVGNGGEGRIYAVFKPSGGGAGLGLGAASWELAFDL
ncbi:MAG: hypothetical protein AAF196_09260 [Planctomycetota bacterium]